MFLKQPGNHTSNIFMGPAGRPHLVVVLSICFLQVAAGRLGWDSLLRFWPRDCLWACTLNGSKVLDPILKVVFICIGLQGFRIRGPYQHPPATLEGPPKCHRGAVSNLLVVGVTYVRPLRGTICRVICLKYFLSLQVGDHGIYFGIKGRLRPIRVYLGRIGTGSFGLKDWGGTVLTVGL